MAKKLVAVTEIRHDDKVIPAGDTLDASMFDKNQLEQLYDAGAIRVDDGSESTTATGPSAEEVDKMRAEADKANAEETAKSEEQQKLQADQAYVSADQSAAASSPAGEPKAPAAKSTAPAAKGVTDGKGTAK